MIQNKYKEKFTPNKALFFNAYDKKDKASSANKDKLLTLEVITAS